MNTAMRTKGAESQNPEQLTADLLTKAASTIERIAADQKSGNEAVSKLQEKQGEILERLQDVEQRKASAASTGAEPSIGIVLKTVTENEGFNSFRQKDVDRTPHMRLDVSIKALLNDTGDVDTAHTLWPSLPDRIPGAHGYVMRRVRLIDVLPTVPQSTNSFEYVRLSFTGDAEVQDGEGAEKAEMDFAGDLVPGKCVTIAVHTTASAQVLDDNAQLEATIQAVMRQKVLQKLEVQLIVGSGTGVNMEGIYTAASAISTPQNVIPDRIGWALTEMETAGYEPDVILMHPRDWFEIATMKDAEGRYLFGDPASPAPPSLWNRPVITSSQIPQGTAMVADVTKAQVRDRMQATVFISRDHKDYRTRNLVLILIELRAGLAIFDDGAFRKVSLAAQT